MPVQVTMTWPGPPVRPGRAFSEGKWPFHPAARPFRAPPVRLPACAAWRALGASDGVNLVPVPNLQLASNLFFVQELSVPYAYFLCTGVGRALLLRG